VTINRLMLGLERAERAIGRAIDAELRKHGVEITPEGARILHGIGDQEVTFSDIIGRGYYTGTNAAYHKKRLLDAGYITQSKGRDTRCVKITLTDKGHKVQDLLQNLFDVQEQEAGRHDLQIPLHLKSLDRLDRFFSGLVV
jgi:DNA-binding MarR family transcriptional regulator